MNNNLKFKSLETVIHNRNLFSKGDTKKFRIGGTKHFCDTDCFQEAEFCRMVLTEKINYYFKRESAYYMNINPNYYPG